MSRSDVLATLIAYREPRAGAPAVKDLDRALSYAELMDEVDRWASGLVGRGVQEGDRVALHLPNSVDFVVAALACLRVGAIFVPLAVTDPAARIDAILEDCTPVLVVTSGEPADPRATSGRPDRPSWIGCSDLPHVANQALPPVTSSPPDRLAYAIYTSGTTGSPKGVMISQRAFAAAVRATANALGLDQETRTLCVSPFYFDGSFGTLFPTLFVGGAVVIRPRESLLFPRTFFNAVLKEGITYTGFSPSYLKLLLSNPQMTKLRESTLNIVALGGEASSVADIRALWAAAPSVRVFNRYGPTETTIAVTHIELTPELVADGTVPLGVPHPDVAFHIVDDDGLTVTDDGVIGELYIGGAQLMSGYWGAPALTEEVMRTDIVPGETVYRTGDLVYRNLDGQYVFVDRSDRVVKRSGVRISLLELSDALQNLSGVTSATCVVYDSTGDVGIAAFVVADGTRSVHDLRQGARDRLPDTMLPDRIDLVDELPLTAAGKLDERRLLAEAGLMGPVTSRPKVSATMSA